MKRMAEGQKKQEITGGTSGNSSGWQIIAHTCTVNIASGGGEKKEEGKEKEEKEEKKEQKEERKDEEAEEEETVYENFPKLSGAKTGILDKIVSTSEGKDDDDTDKSDLESVYYQSEKSPPEDPLAEGSEKGTASTQETESQKIQLAETSSMGTDGTVTMRGLELGQGVNTEMGKITIMDNSSDNIEMPGHGTEEEQEDKKPVLSKKNCKEMNRAARIVHGAIKGGFDGKQTATLVVGADSKDDGMQMHILGTAIRAAAAAERVSKLIIGENGILSTPAVSCLIRKEKIDGGIMLFNTGTEGHCAGRFYLDNGEGASARLADKMEKATQEMKNIHVGYGVVSELNADISKIGTQTFQIDGRDPFSVQKVDAVGDYTKLMKDVFDFDPMRKLISGELTGKPFKILIYYMPGSTGPFVSRILGEVLGVKKEDLRHKTNTADLDEKMKSGAYDLGVVLDQYGDGEAVWGKNAFFVPPSDSMAVLAAHLDCIPYFKKTGVKGFARSLATARAVDRVAEDTGRNIFEVPTGSKYFANLMDAGLVSLCGEESFGLITDHIRVKDGMWACLAWLQVLADRQKSVEEILFDHWAKYGRNVFARYEYKNCEGDGAFQMMAYLETEIGKVDFVGKEFGAGDRMFKVSNADQIDDTDPVDQSVSKKEGIEILFEDGSRLVFRLSETESPGATIGLYGDRLERDKDRQRLGAQELCQPLIAVALEMSKFADFVGRAEPTEISY